VAITAAMLVGLGFNPLYTAASASSPTPPRWPSAPSASRSWWPPRSRTWT
jgi:hypothetical protein